MELPSLHQSLGAKTHINFPPKRTQISLSPMKPNTQYIAHNTILPDIPKQVSSAMAKAKQQQFWLLKTEPREWSWEDQAANGGISKWDGVKNKQAQKYLKSMTLDDLCFFYHSGPNSRRVVGVVKVTREWYEEEEEEGGAVDVEAVGEMRRPVDLKEMKKIKESLKGFALFRQPRLSVVPVTEDVWKQICDLGGGFEGDGLVLEEDD